MRIEIKIAESKDWKLIQKLNNEVFQADKENDTDLDLDWPFSETGIKYYKSLASGTYGGCFIAYLDKKPVGYVALGVKDFGYRKSQYVEIENIGVSPDFRSLGIGQKLMADAIKWANEQKINKLYVAAYWKNTRAIQFYKNFGFTEMGLELEMDIT